MVFVSSRPRLSTLRIWVRADLRLDLVHPHPCSCNMGVLIHNSARLIFKRTFQRQQNLRSPTKRHKAAATEMSVDRSPQTVIKGEGKAIARPKDTHSQPFWERLGPLSEAFGVYGRTQKKRPWTTQIGTSLLVYFCGDQVAQKIDGGPYSPWRTIRHLTIGGICSIPAYTWLVLSRLSIP